MTISKNAAIISIIGLLIGLASPVDAARVKTRPKTNHAIAGIVINHKGKPVSGAHIHIKHTHKSTTRVKAAVKVVKPVAKVAKATHHGTMSKADGTFHMTHRHGGVVTLIAHKKGVGTGHAKAKAGSTVTIKIHKHHRHHSK